MARLNSRSISRRTVEALQAGEREAVYWDSELQGFGIRVYPSGSKVYLVQTRKGGRSRRLTLGRHGLIPVDQARTEAARIIADIKAGGEPLPANGAAPADAGPTVAEVAERYMREHVAARCKPTTVRQCRHTLDHHLLPALGAEPLEAIGRERVAALHYSLHETPGMANKVVGMLSRLFYMAEGRGIAAEGGNPCKFVRKYKEPGCERTPCKPSMLRRPLPFQPTRRDVFDAERGRPFSAPVRQMFPEPAVRQDPPCRGRKRRHISLRHQQPAFTVFDDLRRSVIAVESDNRTSMGHGFPQHVRPSFVTRAQHETRRVPVPGIDVVDAAREMRSVLDAEGTRQSGELGFFRAVADDHEMGIAPIKAGERRQQPVKPFLWDEPAGAQNER